MEDYMKRISERMTKKITAMEEDMQLFSSKKRKCYSEPGNEYFGDDAELEENSVSPSPATSSTSGCGKHEECSRDVVKKSVGSPDLENVDLQSEGFETEFSASIDGVFSREATPTSELYGDSEQVLTMNQFSTLTKKKSSPPPPSRVSRRNVPASVADKMPSAAELEEFFAAAEKYEQQRFIEKYNYDIVKDVPLEGKYQWVRL